MPSTLTLVEHEPLLLPADALSPAIGRRLWRDFHDNGRRLLVEFPTPATDQKWRLTNNGWVGVVEAAPGLRLALRPHVPLANLFRLWTIAARLAPLGVIDRLVEIATVADFYDALAAELAGRVVRRLRLGLQAQYGERRERLPVIRGRLLLAELLRDTPPDGAAVAIPCLYEHHDVDHADNQIVLWTLGVLGRSGLCSARSLALIRRAYRALAGAVTLRPYTAADCRGRAYDRLNGDYAALHALCAFFLDQAGPTHDPGARPFPAFMTNMSRLFEQFVARFVGENLPDGWTTRAQSPVVVGPGRELRYQIDLLLLGPNGRRLVVDTKYKRAPRVAPADVNQIIAYAKLRRCQEAVLVYPTPLEQPLDLAFDDIHLRTLTFPLDGAVGADGRRFCADLVRRSRPLPVPTI